MHMYDNMKSVLRLFFEHIRKLMVRSIVYVFTDILIV